MNEKGSILIITLLVLLLGSLIAVSSVNISTQETRIASNERLYTSVFFEADAGVAPGLSVLLNTYKNKNVVDVIPEYTAAGLKSVSWTEDTYQSGQNTFLDEVMGASSPAGAKKGIIFESPRHDHTDPWDTPSGKFIRTTVIIKRIGATSASSGSSVEFATGSEGTGYGSGSGVQIHYFVRPTAVNAASGASASVETEYRKVSAVGE